MVKISVVYEEEDQNETSILSVQSEPRYGERSPVWDTEFVLSIEATQGSILIQVYDVSTNELVGVARQELRELLHQNVQDEWYTLKLLDEKTTEHESRLRLIFQFTHSVTSYLTRQLNDEMKDRRNLVDKRCYLLTNKVDNYYEMIYALFQSSCS